MTFPPTGTDMTRGTNLVATSTTSTTDALKTPERPLPTQDISKDAASSLPLPSCLKSTIQYSSAIALGQTVYILSVFISLAQLAVIRAKLFVVSVDRRRCSFIDSIAAGVPSDTNNNSSISTSALPRLTSTTITTTTTTTKSKPVIPERYTSRIKRVLVKTLSGNFVPVTLKRVTFDDETIQEEKAQGSSVSTSCRVLAPDTNETGPRSGFAACPKATSPPTSPTSPTSPTMTYLVSASASVMVGTIKTSVAQPHASTMKNTNPPHSVQVEQARQSQHSTQPKINKSVTTSPKKPLPIFTAFSTSSSLSSMPKSTTPTIINGLRGIHAISSLVATTETTSSSSSSSSSSPHSASENRSAPATETRDKIAQQEATDRKIESILVVPEVIISSHSPVLPPHSRPTTPPILQISTSTTANESGSRSEPTDCKPRNSLSVNSLETRARRSLSLVRSRPSSILGEDDRKELEEKNRRRGSMQLDQPPNMLDILRPANSTIATAERRGSVNISSAKTFLFKMTHPQRYKREQQEELQQLSYSASVASFKSEIHPPQDDDTASDKDVNVNDASSTMSLPVSPSAPAQLQQQLPPPSMPQQQGAMLFQPSPEYFDHLDSSETTHADSYFPQPRAPTAVSGATVRSSLFRRSMMFLEKPEDEDFTSFLAFGHTSSAVQSLGNDSTLSISSLTSFSTTSSSTSSSVRPAFFTRSSTSETSTPPASSPATSPRTSINLGYPTRPVLSKAGTGGSSKTTSGFGLAAALAGTTSVSTAMAGVVHGSSSNVDGTSAESMIVDDGASVFSIGSIQSAASEECRGSSIRGRNGFVKKLGLKK